MNGNGDFLSRVLDDGKKCEGEFNGGELGGDFGFGEDEIMVEIVGADVFVDGVGGNEMNGNVGNGGVGMGNAGGGGFVEEQVGVEDYGVTEDVVFLENGGAFGGRDEVTGSGEVCFGNVGGLDGRDEVTGSGEMCFGDENGLDGHDEAKGGDMCCENDDGLERRDEVLGSGDMGCALSTSSTHEYSGVRDEGFSCESEVSGGNCMVATGLSCGETEVIEEKLNCCSNEDAMEQVVDNSDGSALQVGFSSDDASNANADSGFRGYSVIAKAEEILEKVSEAILKRTEVLDLKEDPATGVNCISGCSKEVQNTKCDPVAEKSDLHTLEESSHKQGLVSETRLVEHMKVVESFGNDVAQEQHDIGILSEGIVEASVATLSDEKMDSNSRPRVVNGDMNLVKDTNLSRLDSRGSGAVNEEKKDDMLKPDVKRRGSLGSEDDENKILNQPFTGEILNEGDTDLAIPHSIDDVTNGSEAVLSSDMLHREVTAVLSSDDVPSHLPDCNWNSIVNVMSDGVTSDELLHLTFQKGNNEAVMGSLVKIQGSHLDENVSLSYELNCEDSNVQGTERKDLQYSTGNHTGVSSDHDHILEVKYDEEQVDVRTDLELETHDETINIGESEVIDEKIAEQVSPRSASSTSEFHSRYLLPPNIEGEFSIGDLVWSKDRSLPWWPGQIFDPADASEKAMKHYKNDCFLVTYFGIRTFAWNDKSQIRPFRTHFSQIEDQRNSEACHEAINCALLEVSRRVQLGLACSCIPKSYFTKIKSQNVKNIGIHREAGRRIRLDDSTAASCFEPRELLKHIRSLSLLPSVSCDGHLQLTISKAQVAAFSHFKGQHPLPKFHSCDGLLENDANTSRLSDVIQEHSEQVTSENNTSSTCKREMVDSLPPRKKGRSISELIGDMPESDGEEECDSDIRDPSVTSSAARKRKALESLFDGSGKRQVYYAAKVSTTVSQTPKKSFKVGDCILKVASQLTGSPSLVKCYSEKFVETDDSVDEHHGFDYVSQASVNSQQGQNCRKRNQRKGRVSGKNKAPQTIINPPEDFEFDDINDSYWTDRKVQIYDEEQILDRDQNGEGENQEQILDTAQYGEATSQLVPSGADKPVKSGQRSRKRFSSGKQVMVAEEPVVDHMDIRRPDCSPTGLILKFTEGKFVPSELNLNKTFRRFGPLREHETEIDRESSSAKVVYKRCSDAKVALSSAGVFNIFGPVLVSYELSYSRSAPFKTLPAATVQNQEDAS